MVETVWLCQKMPYYALYTFDALPDDTDREEPTPYLRAKGEAQTA